MAPQDFDIDTLADYLHLERSKVARMADRGQLPGRKIGGKWRFAQAEIHHWLERRIGDSNEVELARVEGVLRPQGTEHSDDWPRIAEMLPREAIAVPLLARTRASVVSSMVELAVSTGLLWDGPKMTEAVKVRENLHPTALDNGVALLHPRRPMPAILAEGFLALGVAPRGVPFGGSHGRLTDVFFLVCSTADREHLRVLARLSRLIADESLLNGLRAAESASDAQASLASLEETLFG